MVLEIQTRIGHKIPFLSSGSWLIIWIILFPGFQDAKDNMNQFSHNRADDNLPIFAVFTQADFFAQFV